jgi:hypothetical protein
MPHVVEPVADAGLEIEDGGLALEVACDFVQSRTHDRAQLGFDRFDGQSMPAPDLCFTLRGIFHFAL